MPRRKPATEKALRPPTSRPLQYSRRHQRRLSRYSAASISRSSRFNGQSAANPTTAQFTRSCASKESPPTFSSPKTEESWTNGRAQVIPSNASKQPSATSLRDIPVRRTPHARPERTNVGLLTFPLIQILNLLMPSIIRDRRRALPTQPLFSRHVTASVPRRSGPLVGAWR